MKNCSLEYRTVFESHSQLKLKSGATYCINPELKPRTCPIFPALLGCGDSSVPWQLQNKVKQKTFPLTSNYREQEHVFFFSVHQTRKQSTCLVSDEPNKHKCQNIGCIQPRMWHLLVTETASKSLHVRPLLPPLPELLQLWKHFQTPARSTRNQVFTESGWLLVGSELPACSAIQERVDKLTVVLAEARLIANVVEFTYKVR